MGFITHGYHNNYSSFAVNFLLGWFGFPGGELGRASPGAGVVSGEQHQIGLLGFKPDRQGLVFGRTKVLLPSRWRAGQPVFFNTGFG